MFCDLPAQGKAAHRENLILGLSDDVLVLMNRYPYNPGHLLIVPRRHLADPQDLSSAAYQALTEALRQATSVVKASFRCDGINVGMNLGRAAGAGIAEHCHYHVVPRWEGDANFMATVGQTRVMSVGLDQAYDQLQPAFAEMLV